MTVHLHDFNLADVLYVCGNLPDDERELFEAINGEQFNADDVAAAAFQCPGMHWVIRSSGGIALVAGGFVRQRPGVFRTWFFATEFAWTSHGGELTLLVRDVIQRLLDERLAHRVETVTLANRHRARKWYEQIGLKQESTLRGYAATGEDAVLYVATRQVENI